MEHQIQAIAANTAASAAQDFVGSLPPEVLQTLSPSYLQHLEEDLRTELCSLLQSRLLWSQQAIQLELEGQQRHQHQAPTPSLSPTLETAHPTHPDFLQKPSASSELLAELRSDLQAIPAPGVADSTPRKRILTPRPSTQDLTEQAPQLLAPPPVTPPLPPASQVQQPAATEETPRPSRRLRGKEPQLTREEIIKAYQIPPEWLNPSQDSEAKPRRRRRSSAAMA